MIKLQIRQNGDLITNSSGPCRFDFFDLHDFKAALAKPGGNLLAKKTVLLTEKGKQVLKEEQACR